MRDKELCLEILGQIEEASAKIILRFDPIHQVSDFQEGNAPTFGNYRENNNGVGVMTIHPDFSFLTAFKE